MKLKYYIRSIDVDSSKTEQKLHTRIKKNHVEFFSFHIVSFVGGMQTTHEVLQLRCSVKIQHGSTHFKRNRVSRICF